MTFDCHIEHRAAQPILGVRFMMTPGQADQALIGAAYERLVAYAGAHGTVLAGPPMMIVREMGQPLQLEAAVPVAMEVPGEGDIVASVLPEGDVVATVHVGPWGDVGPAYEAVFAYAGQHGRRPAGPPYESYLTSPEEEPDTSKYRTEVCLPVA